MDDGALAVESKKLRRISKLCPPAPSPVKITFGFIIGSWAAILASLGG